MKKIAIQLSLASILVSSLGLALAGGITGFHRHLILHNRSSGIYVEGNLGYISRNWLEDGGAFGFFLKNNTPEPQIDNARGGFGLSIDSGYQFNRYVSLEAGWIRMPELTVKASNDRISSWALYGAVKGQVSIYRNLSAFLKIGMAYNNDDVTGDDFRALIAESQDHVSALAGAGLQYSFTKHFSANVQYLLLTGESNANDDNKFVSPNVYLFTIGLGYKFSV